MKKSDFKPCLNCLVRDRDKDETYVILDKNGVFSVLNDFFCLEWVVGEDASIDKTYRVKLGLFNAVIDKVKHTSDLEIRGNIIYEYSKDGTLLNQVNMPVLSDIKPWVDKQSRELAIIHETTENASKLKSHDNVKLDIEEYPQLKGIIANSDGDKIQFCSTNGYSKLVTVMAGDVLEEFSAAFPDTYLKNTNLEKLFGKFILKYQPDISIVMEDDDILFCMGITDGMQLRIKGSGTDINLRSDISHTSVGSGACLADVKAFREAMRSYRGDGDKDDTVVLIRNGIVESLEGNVLFDLGFPFDSTMNPFDMAICLENGVSAENGNEVGLKNGNQYIFVKKREA